MNDANYPWLMLVPRRPGWSRSSISTTPQQAQLMDEIALTSRVLKDVTACDKLNVAAIGNVVAQLHVHIVARREERRGLAEAGVGRGAARRPMSRPRATLDRRDLQRDAIRLHGVRIRSTR